jgi:hypothetical protein
MKIGQINFPDELIKALRNNELVVFAGAGVSMGEPANLPDFKELAREICREDPGEEPVDRFLGKCQKKGAQIHERAKGILNRDGLQYTQLHSDILRLFSGKEKTRLVTTNLDLLFEQAAKDLWGELPEIFKAPTLPLGTEFYGIVHVHGAVSGLENGLVLTDRDFGRAYLTEGWARRYLVDVFRIHTVLFIGYSHNDPILQYLARALPEKDVGLRFALDRENPKQEWEHLGIKPIPYPTRGNNDFSALCEGMKCLSDHLRKGILDWRREINAIASAKPPIDPQSVDLINDALRDSVKTQFFVESARDPEWVDWLDGQGFLTCFFEPNPLHECSKLLSFWFGKHFAFQYSALTFSLILSHGLKLNPEFWISLAQFFTSPERSSLTPLEFTSWISLLLQTSPSETGKWIPNLVKKCIENGEYTSALQVFSRMFEYPLRLEEPFPYQEGTDSEVFVRQRIDLPFKYNHCHLNEVWQNSLKPHLNILALPILSLAVVKIEDRQASFEQWGMAKREWCPDSYRRSGIEINDSEAFRESIDVVIDMARDALEWISQTDQTLLISWCERLIRSEAPLLRRLAVFALLKNHLWDAGSKIQWLLRNANLFETSQRHEIFMAMKEFYPAASETTRTKIVQIISDYQWPDENDPLKDQHRAVIIMNWFQWLSDATPTCNIVTEAYSRIREDFPDLGPEAHPELLSWSYRGQYSEAQGHDWWASPWTVEELLFRSAAEWMGELLEGETTPSLRLKRMGIQQVVIDASSKNFEWGLDLAQSLASAEQWKSDLWDCLLHGWANWPEDKEKANKILEWIKKDELVHDHVGSIASVLYGLVNKGEKEYTLDLLSETNRIAKNLWSKLDRHNLETTTPTHWIDQGINFPAGQLAIYWMKNLAVWLKNQSPPESRVLSEEYKEALSQMLADETVYGGYARSVISRQLTWLYELDEEWTVGKLLPYFSDADTMHFLQAWEGFLAWGSLTFAIVDKLKDPFIHALSRIDEFSDSRRRFIEYFVAAFVFFSSNPLKDWIRPFFLNASVSDRQVFARHVGFLLRNQTEEQQKTLWNVWLHQYWLDRIDGIPRPLVPEEFGPMLDWLPLLPSIFPETVDTAIKMSKKMEFEGLFLFFHELQNSKLLSKYPDSVAKIIGFILDCPGSRSWLFGLDNILLQLNQNLTDPTVKKKLKETLISVGLLDSAILLE